MTQTTISHSLTYMFKDEDWFWKVSLGALALFSVCLGAGYFLVVGYQVETVRRCRRNDHTLPDWNALGQLWRSGLRVGGAALCYCAAVTAALVAFRQTGMFAGLIAVVLTHTFILPFLIIRFVEEGTLRSCFSLGTIASMIRGNGLRAATVTLAGFAIFTAVLCFGWMALIVGWPFFIFWGMLAAASFTAALSSSSDTNGISAQ
jgi:hypothetical protein